MAKTLRGVIASAELSYAKLSDVPGEPTLDQIAVALDEIGLSRSQSAWIRNAYSIVHHTPNSQNGFSATLLRDSGGDGSSQDFLLSIRGTEEVVSDILGADFLGIVLTGAAYAQILELYNYWQRLIAPSGASVKQARFSLGNLAQGAEFAALGAGDGGTRIGIEFYQKDNSGVGAFDGLAASPKVIATIAANIVYNPCSA